MEKKYSPMTQKVLDILKETGHITHVIATHYNIGCVRKEVSKLRHFGWNIITEKKVDSDGVKYSSWKLV